MKVVIATVDQLYFDGEATSVTAPGSDGELTVFGHHMPFITTLKQGVVTVRSESVEGGKQMFKVESGVLEVSNNSATIIL